MIVYNSSIVRDGLVLHLDAANIKSYPGSGVTVNDLSGNGNNGTLVNGVGYNTANNGFFTFDATDDYINAGQANLLFPGPSINATLTCWIKPNTIYEQAIYLGMQNPVGNRLYLGNWDGNWDAGFGDYAWNGSFTGIRALVTLTWTHLSLQITNGIAKLFVNGRETITKTQDTSVSLLGTFPIGVYFYQGSIDLPYKKSSSISQVCIYNRPLSLQEIRQNFEATRGRYGI